jgi:hypothetical protein
MPVRPPSGPTNDTNRGAVSPVTIYSYCHYSYLIVPSRLVEMIKTQLIQATFIVHHELVNAGRTLELWNAVHVRYSYYVGLLTTITNCTVWYGGTTTPTR